MKKKDLEKLIEEITKSGRKISEAKLGGKGGLVKYVKRIQLMKKRIESKLPFINIDGKNVVFDQSSKETQTLILFLDQLINDYADGNPITDAKDPRYKQLAELTSKAGHPLTKLRKDPEMGGEAGEKRLKAEQRQINEIATQIKSILKSTRQKSIKILVNKNKIVDVNGVSNVSGTPKADCALTLDGNPVSYLSLKSADKASEMLQWSGITGHLRDAEVAKFIADLFLLQATGKARLDVAYARPVKNENDSLKYVYGKDYKGDPSPESCDLVLATKKPIKLRPTNEGSYSFDSMNIFYNPELPSGEWTPTFYGRYAKGRKDVGLSDARISISPLGYRKKREILPEFDVSPESIQKQAALKLSDIIVDERYYEPEEDVYAQPGATVPIGDVSSQELNKPSTSAPFQENKSLTKEKLSDKIIREMIEKVIDDLV